MKILQICYSYPPSFSGYGKQLETVNRSILKKDNNIEITVLTAFDGEYHLNNESTKNKVYGFFKKNRKNYKKESLTSYLFGFFCIFRFFKEFYTSDVVHIVKAGSEAAIAILICKIFRKPTIVKIVQNEIPTNPDKSKQFSISNIKNRIILKWADSIISISGSVRNFVSV